MEKWTSRKFIATLITLLCIIGGNIAGLDGEGLAALLIPLVYVIVEGLRDIVTAMRKKDEPK